VGARITIALATAAADYGVRLGVHPRATPAWLRTAAEAAFAPVGRIEVGDPPSEADALLVVSLAPALLQVPRGAPGDPVAAMVRLLRLIDR
jgi:hypothetical protein